MVDSLNTDNFIVRRSDKLLSYSQRESWSELSERDFAAISKQLTVCLLLMMIMRQLGALIY